MSIEKNVRFVFDRRHTATADRTAALEYVVPMGTGRRRFLPSGFRLYAGEWDGTQVVGRPDAKKLNRLIDAARQRANKQIVSAINLCGKLTDADVDRIFGVDRIERRRPELFFPWAREQNENRNVGRATKVRLALALDKLEKSRLVRTFDDLTPARMKRFDDWLRRENPARKDVTLRNCYHKPIQWLCGCAVAEELIDKNPYTVFRPRPGHTQPRNPLTAAELDLLRAAPLTGYLAKARDLFIFGAYTGLAYSDTQLVDESDVVERGGVRYIDTRRRKTGTRFLTPLLAPAAEVMARYGGRPPVLSNQRANTYLRQVARRVGIDKPLTTHVARHTFATTVALAHGVPIESLSRMLGHTNIRTTQIYARVLAQTVADDGARLAAQIQ